MLVHEKAGPFCLIVPRQPFLRLTYDGIVSFKIRLKTALNIFFNDFIASVRIIFLFIPRR